MESVFHITSHQIPSLLQHVVELGGSVEAEGGTESVLREGSAIQDQSMTLFRWRTSFVAMPSGLT